jgi:Kef-type K+ transport system membrane component KefB
VNYGVLSLSLLVTLLLAFVMAKLKVSPVIAYMLGGFTAATFLGFSFSSPEFSLLNFLALNLLAFEIGASFNISATRELFRRALVIALTEMMFILLLSYFFGIYFLHLDPFLSLFLVLASIDTSTAILYKLTEKTLNYDTRDLLVAVASIEDIEVFFLYSIIVALNGTFSPLRTTFTVVEVILAGLTVYVFAKYFISGLSKAFRGIEEESISILLPVALVFVFEYVSELTNIPATLTMILAGLAFSTVDGSDRVLKLTSPIREFALIFFFLSVGSYFQLTSAFPLLFGISLVVLVVKYFSFSTASWITGENFVHAFRNGLYMLPISEFGIIVSLQALQQGLDVTSIYYVSVTVVLVSSIFASVIANRVREITKLIDRAFSSSVLLKEVNSLIMTVNHAVIKDVEQISKNRIFRDFMWAVLYVFLPYVVFPIVVKVEELVISPLPQSQLLLQVVYAFETALAILFSYQFSRIMSRIFKTLLNFAELSVMRLRARSSVKKLLTFFTSRLIVLPYYLIALLYIVLTAIPLSYKLPTIAIPVFVLVSIVASAVVQPLTFGFYDKNKKPEIVRETLRAVKRLKKRGIPLPRKGSKKGRKEVIVSQQIP